MLYTSSEYGVLKLYGFFIYNLKNVIYFYYWKVFIDYFNKYKIAYELVHQKEYFIYMYQVK